MKLVEFLSEHWKNILFAILGIAAVFLLWKLLLVIWEYRVGVTLTLMILTGLVGLVLVVGAFPSRDGRFRTGYKDNAEFSFTSLISGLGLLGVAFLLLLLLGYFSDKNETEEGTNPIVIEADQIVETDSTNIPASEEEAKPIKTEADQIVETNLNNSPISEEMVNTGATDTAQSVETDSENISAPEEVTETF